MIVLEFLVWFTGYLVAEIIGQLLCYGLITGIINGIKAPGRWLWASLRPLAFRNKTIQD